MSSDLASVIQGMKGPRVWLTVGALSIGATLLGQVLQTPSIGIAGCIIGSVVLAAIAFFKPKRDIVSLLTPMYAIIIFYGLEMPPTIWTQILFAMSITILAIRLEKKFND
jgi:hypothetical protein